jgi:hypothetical protein
MLERRLEGADLLIIGRECLSGSLLPVCGQSIRRGLSVIVFEQKAEVLESLGFRTLDIGSRYTFATAESSPFLKGIPEEGLCNWRGSSTLVEPYPMTLEPPAGEVQPYRWGSYGTVSTVVIEKPHFGTFTPVLDAEFDLRYSPLLLWHLGRGRVLFCQVDITGRYGKEPAATLLAKNILEQMQDWDVSSEPGVALAIGSRAFNLLKKTGMAVEELAEVNALDRKMENSVVVVGDDISADNLGQYREKLAQFVERGGHVVCLSMDSGQLHQVVPFEVKTKRDKLSRTEMETQPVQKILFDGLSISDLHYRGFVEADVITGLSSGSISDSAGCLAAVNYGKGRYVFCQVGPWDVSPEKQYSNAYGKKVSADFLRYSQWHVYRMISQILTNLGVAMEPGRADVLLEGPGWKVDLSGMWKAHYSPPDDLSQQKEAYTQRNFDDSGWTLIRAPGGQWPVQGKEELFSHRDPADKSGTYSIWYRKTVKVPAQLEGKDLQLYLGVIDDADETYVNGVKVGGISRENSDTYWQEERVYNVPSDIVNYGEENVVAFRMTDYQGGWGGFTRGPLMYLTVAGRGDTSLYAEPLKIDDNPYRVYWW